MIWKDSETVKTEPRLGSSSEFAFEDLAPLADVSPNAAEIFRISSSKAPAKAAPDPKTSHSGRGLSR
jgi:hypothetical protein